MSDGSEVVYSYVADSSGIMDAIDEVSSGIQGLIEDINGLVEASSALGEFTGIFEEIAAIFSGVDEAAMEATSGIAGMAEEAGVAADALGALGADGEAFAEVGASADEASAQIEGLQSTIDSLSATIAEDTQIIDGLNEAVANLEGQLDALTGSADTAAEAAGNMSISLSENSSAFSEASASASVFIENLGSAAGGIGDFTNSIFMGAMQFQVFSQMATQAASSLLGPAASAETMQTAFTTLMGSTQAATAEMQKLDAFASKTPFKTMDIDQAASQLIGFGISAQDVVPDLTAIGDSLSAVGKGSTANLMGVVNIFGKIQTQGGLTVGIMQQLSRYGINAWQIMEDETGKTKDQLTDMIQQGLLPAKDAMNDLTEGIEKNPLYSGGMAKQSATAAGLISTLQSNWEQFLAALGTPILKALEGDLGAIGNALASPAFKDFAANAGQKIVDTFESMGKFISTNVTPALSQVIPYFQSPAFKEFASVVGGGVRTALDDIGLVVKTVVKPAIEDFIGVLKSPRFTDFLHKMEDLGERIDSVVKPAIAGLEPIIKDVFSFVQNTVLPILSGLADKINTTIEYFQKHQDALNNLRNTLGIVAAVIGGIVVAAFGAWAISAGAAAIATIAATWPLLLIGAAIGLLAAAFIAAYNNSAQFRTFIADLGTMFSDLWSTLVTDLTPAWNQMQQAFQQALPMLQMIGEVIGGVLLTVLGVLVAAVAGIAKGLEVFVKGLMQLLGGLVTYYNGIFNVLGGIIAFFVDLFTGNFGKLRDDLGQILTGLQQMFFGFSEAMQGIWNSTFGAIIGFVAGFVSGLLSYFEYLFDALVGHSIVPDLVNAIINWFEQLPAKALEWGGDMVKNFAGGINNFVGEIGQACLNVANTISSYLHFSKPDVGPLADSDTWMADFGNQLSQGLTEQSGKVKTSSDSIASAITNSDLSKLGDTAKSIVKAFGGIASEIQTVFGPIVKSLTDLDQLGTHVDDLQLSAQYTAKAFDKLGDAIQKSFAPVEAAKNAFDGLAPSMNKAFDAVEASIPRFQKLGPAFTATYGPIKAATDGLAKIGVAIIAAFTPVDKAEKGLLTLGSSTEKIETAAQGAVQAFQTFPVVFSTIGSATNTLVQNLAQFGPALKSIQDAIKATVPQFISIGPALQEAEQPIQNAISSYAKIAIGIDRAFQPINQALSGLRSLKDSLTQMDQAVNNMVDAFGSLLAPAIQKSQLQAMAATTTYASLQRAVNLAANQVEISLPQFKNVAPAMTAAEGPMTKVIGAYNKIAADLQAAFDPILKTIVALSGLAAVVEKIFDPINKAINAFIAFPDVITMTHKPLQVMGSDFDTLKNQINSDGAQILQIVTNFVKTFEMLFNQLNVQITMIVFNILSSIQKALGTNLKNSGYTWGKDFMTQFIEGLKSQQGALNSTVTGVANTISSQLHHTKPEKGPLADDDEWGAHFMDNLIRGIESRLANLGNATSGIATSLAAVNPSNLPQGPSAANGAANAQIAQILQQFLQQQQSRQQVPQPTSANLGAVTQHFSGGININGVSTDINAIFQMLNQLSGLQFEYGQRGATFNY